MTPQLLAATRAVYDAAEVTPERDGVMVPMHLLDALAEAVDAEDDAR